ncbi:MAG: universal stress protein [Bacteroidia bacterium]|nr:universal stress protein [Bacteroidia bacterium]
MTEKHKPKVLIPFDFSDQSRIAIEQGGALAQQIDAELVILHVIEETGALIRFFSNEQMEDAKKTIQKELDKVAADVETRYKSPVESMVARGKVPEKIAEVADLVNATFIVMGTHGADKIKKKFIGSNALRTLRGSQVPVITLRGKKHRKGCKNIVLPLDLTKETREKVTQCIHLAKIYGATVRAVSVQFTTDEFVVNRLTRQMQQVHAFLEKNGVKCTSELIKGIKGEETLAQCIIDYAKKVEGDLILIMTQQEVDWTPFFVGSSAQEIINNSEIPVLSIIPEPKKDLSVFVPY